MGDKHHPLSHNRIRHIYEDREQQLWIATDGSIDVYKRQIREICAHFEIDFLVLQDILNADHPTKIEEHDKYIVLILKLFYPNTHKEENELDELLQQQVCVILGSNYVLTFLEPVSYTHLVKGRTH